MTDTIFAPATGFGRAAVAVIRISGPQASALLHAMAGNLPEPRRLSLRRLRDPRSGEVLDQALVAWMPGPNSFSGEDQAELHLHGSLAVARGGVAGARRPSTAAVRRSPANSPAAPFSTAGWISAASRAWPI